MSLPVSFLVLRVLSHATEDPEKVLEALRQVTSAEALEELELSREKLEGHYGNLITLIKVRVNRKSQIRNIVTHIFSKLDSYQHSLILSELESHIDEEGSLFLRFDKQAAYCSKIQLGSSDPIHLQIKLAIPSKQRALILEKYREMISRS